MTDSRYASPVPPYAPSGVQDDVPRRGPVIEGVVVGGSRPGRSWFGAPAAGARPAGRMRHVPQKSLLLAALLAALLPPIGMLYSTIFGTLVMLVFGMPLMLLTGGGAASVLWPLCVLWAVWGAHRTNQRRLAWAHLMG